MLEELETTEIESEEIKFETTPEIETEIFQEEVETVGYVGTQTPPTIPAGKEVFRQEDGWYLRPIPPKPEMLEPEPPTPEELQKTLTDAVQSHLDTKAQERGYRDMNTIVTYISSTNPIWQTEALACVAWRDAVWDAYHNALNEVTAGQREMPTVEELLAELPELGWSEI